MNFSKRGDDKLLADKKILFVLQNPLYLLFFFRGLVCKFSVFTFIVASLVTSIQIEKNIHAHTKKNACLTGKKIIKMVKYISRYKLIVDLKLFHLVVNLKKK